MITTWYLFIFCNIDTCSVLPKFKNIIGHCRDNYNWVDDDTKDYDAGWLPLGSAQNAKLSKVLSKQELVDSSIDSNDTVPTTTTSTTTTTTTTPISITRKSKYKCKTAWCYQVWFWKMFLIWWFFLFGFICFRIQYKQRVRRFMELLLVIKVVAMLQV